MQLAGRTGQFHTAGVHGNLLWLRILRNRADYLAASSVVKNYDAKL